MKIIRRIICILLVVLFILAMCLAFNEKVKLSELNNKYEVFIETLESKTPEVVKKFIDVNSMGFPIELLNSNEPDFYSEKLVYTYLEVSAKAANDRADFFINFFIGVMTFIALMVSVFTFIGVKSYKEILEKFNTTKIEVEKVKNSIDAEYNKIKEIDELCESIKVNDNQIKENIVEFNRVSDEALKGVFETVKNNDDFKQIILQVLAALIDIENKVFSDNQSYESKINEEKLNEILSDYVNVPASLIEAINSKAKINEQFEGDIEIDNKSEVEL